MLFPVDLMKVEKSGLLMGAICVLFLLCSQPRLSSASVVFDFNASLNDSDPLFSMLLSVFFGENGKEKNAYGRILCVMPFVPTTETEFYECCV